MKLERLLGIINILLDKPKVNVQYLSEQFEVSRRTILRDIETLGNVGFPILTEQGYNGGISMIESYKMDRTFLKKDELSEILVGLKALDSIDKAPSYKKFSTRFNNENIKMNHIQINLGGYYKEILAKAFNTIEQAIDKKHYIIFRYLNNDGENIRKIRPYSILFQWHDWYLRGYCEERKSERLFKIKRMLDIFESEDEFIEGIPEYQFNINDYFAKENFKVKLKFNNVVKWRVIDEYGTQFLEEKDNYFIFKESFENEQFLIQWILSFGENVEVLEPSDIREKILISYEKSLANYEEGDR